MTAARLCTRAFATAAALALLTGPLAGAASAAPKKKTPTPTVSTRPADPTNAQTATFGFSDTAAGSAFTCSLDFAAYVACTSPRTYSGLAAGSHTFRVRAQAPSQTVSSAFQVTWNVDLTPPPAPALSGVPASPTKATTATLTFSDTDAAATFRCSVDGATATTCTSPVQLSALAEGPHTFSVSARDVAGNLSAAASGAWTVDTTPPPAPSVTTGPANPTNATSATFGVFDTDASAALTCSLDGATFAPCGGSTVTYNLLGNGAHTFDLTASDPLGNSASAPRFAWTVDLLAPTPPTILTGPNAVTNVAIAHFTFDPHDATQLRCAVDSTTVYADCGSTFDTAALADGSHTLRVLGRDSVQNESGATPYSWTLDTAGPAAPVVTGPAARTNATSASFTLSDTDSTATFTCALDGAAAAPCASGVSYGGPLANGAHTLSVTAADPAGNTATTAYQWTVDTVRPTVTLTFPSTDVAGTAGATFDEAVRGVSTSSFALRLSTGAGRTATVTCKDAANAVTSCATGAVRTATLRPAAPLVPGEQYALVVNPSGAATVTDDAGNALTAKSVPFRAQTVVQENSVGTRYAWRNVGAASAYGGSYRAEHLGGAQVTYAFTGTSVIWYAVRGRDQGVAYVYVDGVRKATVNNYATATSYKVARTVSGLTNAKHTLRVYVTGLKGSASGTGTYVSVDAVKVGATLNATPSLDALWRSAPASGASGNVAVTDVAGASSWLTFRGTSVSWWTSFGPNRGKAQVYVDGVLKGTYDNYAAASSYNVRRLFGGLTNAVHTVKIVALGTHRAGATGSLVQLDRWTIG